MPALHRRYVVLSLALVVITSACGDSYAPSELGRFTAEIAGGLDRDLDGQAEFRDDVLSSGLGNAFLLAQYDDADRLVHSISLYRWSDQPIVPGTYRVIAGGEPGMTDDDFLAALLLDATGIAGPSSCIAEGGSVRIAFASERRVEGTFELTGRCGMESRPPAAPFEAEGSFTAIPGDFGPPYILRDAD